MLHLDPAVSPPFTAHSELVCDARGRDQVLTVIKAAFRAPNDGGATLESVACEIARRPVFYEGRPSGSIRVPSDLAPCKPGTEVLLAGHARHPAAFRDARWVDVTLSVEAQRTLLRKSVRVFGPRHWIERDGRRVPSEPQRYEDTPLRWEWAWGPNANNPVGRGLPAALAAADAAVECHRIEMAGASAMRPAGFGALAADWEPRASRSGTVVDDLAPYPPSDRDPRHYGSAPDDQWLEQPLRGGETIVVAGVHAHRAWTFRVPKLRPDVSWTIGGRTDRSLPHLDTVQLDADEALVTLSWRVAFPAPRVQTELEEITVTRASLDARDVDQAVLVA